MPEIIQAFQMFVQCGAYGLQARGVWQGTPTHKHVFTQWGCASREEKCLVFTTDVQCRDLKKYQFIRSESCSADKESKCQRGHLTCHRSQVVPFFSFLVRKTSQQLILFLSVFFLISDFFKSLSCSDGVIL